MCPLIEARVLYLGLCLIMMVGGLHAPWQWASWGGWFSVQLFLRLLMGRLKLWVFLVLFLKMKYIKDRPVVLLVFCFSSHLV